MLASRQRLKFATGPVRHRTATRNLALLRKIALNLVAADRSSQTSHRGRRKKAVWNNDYMLRIITRQAHA